MEKKLVENLFKTIAYPIIESAGYKKKSTYFFCKEENKILKCISAEVDHKRQRFAFRIFVVPLFVSYQSYVAELGFRVSKVYGKDTWYNFNELELTEATELLNTLGIVWLEDVGTLYGLEKYILTRLNQKDLWENKSNLYRVLNHIYIIKHDFKEALNFVKKEINEHDYSLKFGEYQFLLDLKKTALNLKQLIEKNDTEQLMNFIHTSYEATKKVLKIK